MRLDKEQIHFVAADGGERYFPAVKGQSHEIGISCQGAFSLALFSDLSMGM